MKILLLTIGFFGLSYQGNLSADTDAAVSRQETTVHRIMAALTHPKNTSHLAKSLKGTIEGGQLQFSSSDGKLIITCPEVGSRKKSSKTRVDTKDYCKFLLPSTYFRDGGGINYVVRDFYYQSAHALIGGSAARDLYNALDVDAYVDPSGDSSANEPDPLVEGKRKILESNYNKSYPHEETFYIECSEREKAGFGCLIVAENAEYRL